MKIQSFENPFTPWDPDRPAAQPWAGTSPTQAELEADWDWQQAAGLPFDENEDYLQDYHYNPRLYWMDDERSVTRPSGVPGYVEQYAPGQMLTIAWRFPNEFEFVVGWMVREYFTSNNVFVNVTKDWHVSDENVKTKVRGTIVDGRVATIDDPLDPDAVQVLQLMLQRLLELMYASWLELPPDQQAWLVGCSQMGLLPHQCGATAGGRR